MVSDPIQPRPATEDVEPQGPAQELSQAWIDWLVANLLAGYSHGALVDVLVRRGFTQPFAVRCVEDTAAGPVFRAAARAFREKRKLASMVGIHAELFSRSGFQLEKRRLAPAEFYRDYFFANRPVVLLGLTDDWPARHAWTPAYFRERFGHVEVEITAGREGDTQYEANFLHHRRVVTMAQYVDMLLEGGPSNDYYLVARNQAMTHPELRPLHADFSSPAGFLDPHTRMDPSVRLWFGPAATLTPLHCDNRHILFAQVYGRKRVKLIPPYFLGSLYNDRACYSAVDLEAIDYTRFPAMRHVPILETELEPGDALFIPITWWHWVKSLDVSISLTLLNFYGNDPEIIWRQVTL